MANTGTMGVNSLPKTVTRQRRDCDLNPGPSSPESSTLTTRRLPSHSAWAAMSHRSMPAWRRWYTGPVVVGNVGDGSVSSYRLRASEIQQLSYVPTAVRYLSVLEVFLNDVRYINPRFTYLLTYLLCGVVREQLATNIGPTCNTP